MAVKVAINGFGRIGRNILRSMVENRRTDLQLVAINDLTAPKTNAHLFKYDSVHGRFHGDVKIEGDMMDVGMGPFKVLAERDPTKLPWGDLGVDVVLECTGIFSDKEKAAVHLAAGAKKVLVSAPSKGADITVVYGVNHDKITAEPSGDLQRLLHDELPRAGRQGAERPVRHPVGLYDDDPFLHQRPAHSRPAA